VVSSTPRSAVVDLPAGGVSAAGRCDVDVVEVAIPTALGAVWRVIDAAPDRVLDSEPLCIVQHVRDDLVAQRDACVAAGIGDHHIEGQTVRMPPQRIWSNTADLVNLGEHCADISRGQNGSHLQTPLRSNPGR